MTAVRDLGGYPALTYDGRELCGGRGRGPIVKRTILGRRWDLGYGEYGLEEILHCRRLWVEL